MFAQKLLVLAALPAGEAIKVVSLGEQTDIQVARSRSLEKAAVMMKEVDRAATAQGSVHPVDEDSTDADTLAEIKAAGIGEEEVRAMHRSERKNVLDAIRGSLFQEAGIKEDDVRAMVRDERDAVLKAIRASNVVEPENKYTHDDGDREVLAHAGFTKEEVDAMSPEELKETLAFIREGIEEAQPLEDENLDAALPNWVV